MTEDDTNLISPLSKAARAAPKEVDSYSKDASTVCRALALSGIAIVWLYSDGGAGQGKFSAAVLAISGQWLMLGALALFILSLVVDIVQYLYGTLRWSKYEYVVDVVTHFDDFKAQFPDDTVRSAWASWAGLDLADYITSTARYTLKGTEFSVTPESNAHNVARARRILGMISDGSDPTGDNQTQLKALRSALSREWAPRRIADVIGRIFWAKSLLTLGGYISLLSAIIAAL